MKATPTQTVWGWRWVCFAANRLLHAMQDTDEAAFLKSNNVFVMCVVGFLQKKYQWDRLSNLSPEYSLSKCLGEGSTNAAWCWMACVSHRANGWLRLPWQGCPSCILMATSMVTTYGSTDTEQSGFRRGWRHSLRDSQRNPRCSHILSAHAHTSMKNGGWVALTNYLHPRHSGVSASEELDGPVGGGWLSGRSGDWVEGGT